MNQNKRDYNGWIVCPSTRFPGKFYYFNVVTGAAAWNLGDIEQQRPIHRPSYPQAEKWHSYPEPDCPPMDESNPYWSYQPDCPYFGQSAPMFGQAVFPKYTPNMVESFPQHFSWNTTPPKYIKSMNPSGFESFPQWSAFKRFPENPMKRDMFPKKMFNTNVKPSFAQDMRTVFGKKPTQNSSGMFMPNGIEKESFKKWRSFTDLKEPIFKRFFSQTNPNTENIDNIFGMIPERKVNEISNQEPRSYFPPNANGAHMCTCPFSKSHDNLASIADNRNFNQRIGSVTQNPEFMRSKSLENLANDLPMERTFTSKKSFVFPKTDTGSKLFSCKSFGDLPNIDLPSKTSLGLKKKAPIALETLEEDGGLEPNLSRTDLRHVLLAKKRKTSSCDSQGYDEGKKIKTRYTDLKDDPPKKRVTFNLGVEGIGENGNPDDDIEPTEQADDPETDADAPEMCYVVVDTEVLLGKFDLIDEFVQTDECYLLLVPQHVHRSLSACSAGGGGARGDVIRARRVVRRLAEPPHYITVQISEPEPTDLTDDPILSCCIHIYNEGYQVILITDNEELTNKAMALNIDCFTTQDVVDELATPKPAPTFDLKRIQSDNNDIEENIPVNCARKQLFANSNLDSSFAVKKQPNAGKLTSLINKKPDFLNQKDILQKTFQISNEIQKLKLKDNETNQKINSFKNLTRNINQTANEQCKKIQKQVNINSNVEQMTIRTDVNKEKRVAIGNPKIQKHVNDKFKKSSEQITITKKVIEEHQITEKIVTINKDGVDKQKTIEVPASLATEQATNFKSQAKEKDDAVVKKKKIKSVNIYNLNEHLKNFREMSNKAMEKRIATRMDEYVCSFSQILEDTLLAALPSISALPSAASPRPPLRDTLAALRAQFADHRTVALLVDKLCAALDEGYKLDSDGRDRLTLCMKPNDFVKMFGAGSLLITCLRNIYPDNAELEEGEVLLEQLLHRIEAAGARSPPSPRPAAPLANTDVDEDRPKHPEVNKNTSHVLQYLKSHYPTWKACDDFEEYKEPVKNPNKVKIVRTVGRNLGSLKLNSGNSMFLSQSTAKSDKNAATTPKIAEDTAKNPDDEVTGPKLMKKLAMQPQLPPKMKEIDVEKREAVNKEMTDMLADMISAKPVTKFYDLDSIIVKKSAENNTKSVKINENKKANENTKAMKYPIVRSPEKSSSNDTKSDKDKPNLQHASQNSEKTPLDLDELDYSEMINDTDGEYTLILDTNDCNDVSTTQKDDENANDVKNDNNNDVNADGNDENNGNDVDFSNGTNDSGFENDSFKAYSFVKTFLTELSDTFKLVYEFIQVGRSELRGTITKDRNRAMQAQAVSCHALIDTIILNLKLISAREADARTALAPLLLRAAPDDRRVTRYNQVVTKCLEQARILRVTLRMLQHMLSGQLDLDSSSGASTNHVEYFNIFE